MYIVYNNIIMPVKFLISYIHNDIVSVLYVECLRGMFLLENF